MYNLPEILRRLNIALFALILIVLSVGFFAPAALAKGDRRVLIFDAENLDNGLRIMVTCHNLIEATARLNSSNATNVTVSHALPFRFSVNRQMNRYELLRCNSKDPGSWKFDYDYNYTIGIPSTAKTVDYVYSLPYPKSKHFPVSQSYLGKFSHFKGSQNEYAVDFVMPEGTEILASRPGVVVSCKGDSKIGGPTKDFIDKQNFVVIKHGDGTYASYDHLKPDGVLVKTGQAVSLGTPIGLSGTTGMSEMPHLHFCVYRVRDEFALISLPFRMSTPKGILKQLQEDQTY